VNKKEILREALRELGKLGGEATAAKLSKKQLVERARKGGKARQAKARKARLAKGEAQ
jgi:general stress protein YciG